MGKLVADHLWGILTVKQEADGAHFENKVRVAEVILNRTKAKYRSDGTIASTCLWFRQFSAWNSMAYDGHLKKAGNNLWRIACAQADDVQVSTQDCIRAWDEALTGSNLSGGALNFYSPKVPDIEKPDPTKIIVLAQSSDFTFYNYLPASPAHV